MVQLKVTLRGIRPPIWRRLRVPSDITLGQLHRALQIVMGWTDSHLHQFCVGRQYFGLPDPDDGFSPDTIDERRVRLDQVVSVGSKLVYEYDFGDGWSHDVVVERAEPLTDDNSSPLCLDGRRARPPEDCGGPYGYAELLAAFTDPTHPEHAERLEWIGPHWHPEDFDIDRINKQLQRLRFKRTQPARRTSTRARPKRD
jgi:Plasmid pRiA4b ORF-3-like protein